MKKLIALFGLMAGIQLAACSQKIKPSAVPDAVKSSFAKNFPGATARWEKEDAQYEAGFTKDGLSMSALFEANGNLIETETEIKSTDLPAAAQAYIKEHYKGKTVKETARITKGDGTVYYEAEINGKDVMFDVTGVFLNEVKD